MVDLSGRGDGKALIVVRNLDKTDIRGSEVIHVLQGPNLDVDRVRRLQGSERIGQDHPPQFPGSSRRPFSG
jgi:hypothetical protein